MGVAWVLIGIGAGLAALAAVGDASPIAVLEAAWARAVLGVPGLLALAAGVSVALRARPRTRVQAAAQDEVDAAVRDLRPANRRLGALCLVAAAGVVAGLAASWVAPDGGIRVTGLGTALFVAAAGVLAMLGGVMVWDPSEALRLERLRGGDGLKGTATVRKVVDVPLPMKGGHRPAVWLDLEVALDGRAAFRVRRREDVPAAGREALFAGATFRVVADRVDPARFVMEWDLR